MAMFRENESLNEGFRYIFSIDYYCPENYREIRFGMAWLKQHTKVDWPLLLMAIGSGYLDDIVYDFALEMLDDDSDRTIFELALFRFDEEPNIVKSDELISKLVMCIDVEDWALAFEKLYYAAICWMYENDDYNIEGFKNPFYDIEASFYYFDVRYNADFPTPLEDERIEKETGKTWIQTRVETFIKVEGEKLEVADFHESEYEEDFKRVLRAWDRIRFNAPIPEAIKSLH